MTWEQAKKIFNIEVVTSILSGGDMEVRVSLESLELKGHYYFSYHLLQEYEKSGIYEPDFFNTFYKRRIIEDFQLERFVGGQIYL
jgi:hypothetical protein